MENLSEPYVRHVNYYETDKMGIVHHSNYIRWFEEARIDFMDKAGLNYKQLEDSGIIIPVLKFSCEHKKPIRFDDNMVINVKPKSFNGVRMTFEYEIKYCNDNTVRAIGETTHFFADDNMEPMNLKKRFPEIYEKLVMLF